MNGEDMKDTADETEQSRRASEPLVLALIGLGIAALLFAGAAVPVLLGRDDDSTDTVDAVVDEQINPAATDAIVDEPPTPSTIVDESAPSSAVADSVESDTTVEPTPTTVAPAPTTTVAPAPTTTVAPAPTTTVAPAPTTTVAPAPTTTVAPATTEAATTAPPPAAPAEVAESRATVLGGKLYLEGAVPDDAARFNIVELASRIFGPDNVIDGYVVDPRAGDPNLGNVQVSDAVLFSTDSAVITPAFEPLLNQGLALLQIRPAATFAFEGHTDARGSATYNLRLSQERADAVVRWYTDRGVDPARLTAVGRGESDPAASNDTPEGRQINRRIEVTIDNLLVDPE